ncbi:TPA: glycosyltransferase family 2 protein [Enterococcus faecium]
MDSAVILMSTYNGEKYIREQLDSIFNQTGIKIKVVVRDDGSTDTTQAILKQYEKKYDLTWYTGDNLKSARSFMDLIYNAPTSKYYAFADQDDVWDKDKLYTAINAIKKVKDENVAVMYSCPTRLVDENLKPIKDMSHNYSYTNSFGGSLIASNATGCTIVFNRKLLTLMQQYKGQNLRMHDDLAHKVCCAMGGKLIRDEKAYISYRQHPNNVVGVNSSWANKWKFRIERMLRPKCERSKFLLDMYECYGTSMKKNEKDLLYKVANYKNIPFGRFRVIFDNRLKGSYLKMNFNFRMAILLGSF